MAIAPPSLRPSAMTAFPAPVSKSTSSISALTHKRSSTLKRPIKDSALMDVLSSPSKRSRVTFDAEVETVSDSEQANIDPLVVREQVRRAIQRHALQDDDSYEKIRSIFGISQDEEDAPSGYLLKVHLQAMIANVSHLGRDCSSLVNTILDSEWIGRDEGYFTLYVKFLGNLAAAQGGYVSKIVRMLVDLMGVQRTRRFPDSKPVRQPRIHRRVLQTCQYITQLVPTASGALADKVSAKLDFEFQKAEERMTFIKNFMKLIDYVPELTSDILTNILRQLIKLDTAIQADLDEEEDDAEDDIMQYMSTSQTLVFTANQRMLQSGISDEDEDTGTTEESDLDDDEDLDETALRRKRLKEDVKQVDMIMDILFQYYSQLTTSTTLQTRDNAIEQLVTQFQNLIMPTYRSRHPQFLIFHFAQIDPIIVDRFVTSCVAILIDKKEPQVLRHAAAAYFSGFVGRGVHVSPSVVSDCLAILCDQLNMLRRTYEATCTAPDLKRYGDFYSIFQAIMYIFCFRWRDIGTVASDDEDEPELFEGDGKIEEYHFSETLREALHSAIYSPLNPLRVCTPGIVEQFAKITMMLQLFYVYPKLEENKRVRIATSWRMGGDNINIQAERDLSWVGDNGMLEGYFPYDPYHLPISKHWIEGDYVEWQGLPGETAEESDSDSDDEVTDGEEEDFTLIDGIQEKDIDADSL